MKNYLILIILSLFIIFSGIWQINYFNDTSRYCLGDINYITNLIDNNNVDGALNHVNELKNTWSNLKNSWQLFIDHDKIFRIDKSIMYCEQYLKNGDINDANIYIEECKTNILDISNSLNVSFFNII